MKENNTNDDSQHACGCQQESPQQIGRRKFLEKICIGLGGLCTAIIGIPSIGFIVGPLFEKIPERWCSVGKVDQFEIGKTVNVTILDASPLPWAGVTAKTAVWIRREHNDDPTKEFIAFSVNCTHLGCPVRWMPDATLFLCPCHGGTYYADGEVAGGPPPKPLPRYPVRINNGVVEVKASPVPITTV